MAQVYVFDFDGTCTVPVEGADQDFLRAHQAGFAQLVGRKRQWAEDQYAEARSRIIADPDAYGWVLGGEVVAPALVDAFVEAQVCAQSILRALGENPETWAEQLNELYQANYLRYRSKFRDELLAVFQQLRQRGTPFYIVTNSDPDKVRERMTILGNDSEWIKGLVRGDARKFVITPGPLHVPEQMFFHGLQRPVKLRKQHYFDVLSHIMQVHDIAWESLAVAGDIAELDLVLPVEMGSLGNLVVGPNTPAYERHWAEQHPRVKVVHNLREVIY